MLKKVSKCFYVWKPYTLNIKNANKITIDKYLHLNYEWSDYLQIHNKQKTIFICNKGGRLKLVALLLMLAHKL